MAENDNLSVDEKLAKELVKEDPSQTSPPTQIILESINPLVGAKKEEPEDK